MNIHIGWSGRGSSNYCTQCNQNLTLQRSATIYQSVHVDLFRPVCQATLVALLVQANQLVPSHPDCLLVLQHRLARALQVNPNEK